MEVPRNKMHHLHWLIPSGPSIVSGSLEKSSMASIRLRSAPSISGAIKMGWTTSYGESIQQAPSTLLIGKIGANNIEDRQSLWLDQIRKAKETSKIVLDYTDHHLGFNSPMRNFYDAVLNEIDACVVSSKSMANLLTSRWDGPIKVIEDPLEVKLSPPKLFTTKPVTFLWFGHPSNMDFLIQFLSTNFCIDDHIRVIVLSDDFGLNYFANARLISPAKIEVNLALWSLENMVEAAKISDVCIIPGDLSDPRKIGVSSNRLITALALGLPTAADHLPSYREFDNYYCDLRGTEFRKMLDDPLKFYSLVTSAQAEIMQRFSVSKIQQEWIDFLSDSKH